MTLYYSESAGALYDTDFANYTLPSDANEITASERDEIIAASMITTLVSSDTADATTTDTTSTDTSSTTTTS